MIILYLFLYIFKKVTEIPEIFRKNSVRKEYIRIIYYSLIMFY